MKTKKILLTLTIAIGLFSSCTEKKTTEEKSKTEVVTEAKKANVVDTIDKAERKRLDSLRQVKEHGHAH